MIINFVRLDNALEDATTEKMAMNTQLSELQLQVKKLSDGELKTIMLHFDKTKIKFSWVFN